MEYCNDIIELVYGKFYNGVIDKDEIITDMDKHINEFFDCVDLDEKIIESIDNYVATKSIKQNKNIIKKVYGITIFDAMKLYERNGYGSYDDLLNSDDEETFYGTLAYTVMRDNIYENLSEFKSELIEYIKRNELEDYEEKDEEED